LAHPAHHAHYPVRAVRIATPFVRKRFRRKDFLDKRRIALERSGGEISTTHPIIPSLRFPPTARGTRNCRVHRVCNPRRQ